jgi:sulfonate transport system permease protein
LRNSVGLAFVGAVVGEYLGSAEGIGYLILQAEGVFDVGTVFAGILLLTGFALVLDWLVGAVEKTDGPATAQQRDRANLEGQFSAI